MESDTYLSRPGLAGGACRVPASKSLGHRALICASLAGFQEGVSGSSHLFNITDSQDIRATLSALRAAGADIRPREGGYEVCPAKAREAAAVDCGESGSTLRFLVPVFSALGIQAEYTGHGRLPKRPMSVYYDLFDAHQIAYKTEKGCLPLTVEGTLTSGRYEIDGGVSSQFVSGLLMALALLREPSQILVKGRLVSRPYADLTLQVMKQFGAPVEEEKREQGTEFLVAGGGYAPSDYAAEPDASQAAFMILAGGTAAEPSGLLIEGLSQETKQGDIVFVDFFQRLGGKCCWEEKGLRVFRSVLQGTFTFDVTDCPDLVPAMAVLGACSTGTIVLTGAGRLRDKESDRLKSLSDNLGALGVDILAGSDTLTIRGKGFIRGGEADGCHDHRIAMALACAGLSSQEGVKVHGMSCTAKSWPSFQQDLDAIRIKRGT